MDTAARIAVAEAFFREIFSLTMPGEIELRTRVCAASDGMSCFWQQSPADAARSAIGIDTHHDAVYYGMGRRTRQRGTRDAVPLLGVVWADLDPPKKIDGERWTEWRIDALRRLSRLDVPPSAVIGSGGGFHAYWLVEQPIEAAEAESINTALCELLDGDPRLIHPNSILRVPGCCNRKYGEPLLVLPFGAWWLPGRHMVAYPPARLPHADIRRTISAKTENLDALLQRVLEKGRGVRRHRDGRVTLCCPFHADAHQSAVVWPEGNFHCSACGINEAASRWTRRLEVARWNVAALVPEPAGKAATVAQVDSGQLRAPRVAIALVGPLLSRKVRVRESRGGILRMAITRESGVKVPFDSPEELAIALQMTGGPMTYRVFWGCVALAQRRPVACGHGGAFTCRAEEIAGRGSASTSSRARRAPRRPRPRRPSTSTPSSAPSRSTASAPRRR